MSQIKWREMLEMSFFPHHQPYKAISHAIIIEIISLVTIFY